MGEYEAAHDWSHEGLWERQQHPKMPLSMLANPAPGHFAATDAKVEYLALFLKKAVQYRLPNDWDAVSAPKLIPIDPTENGWLVDKWRRDQPPTAPAAPDGKYTGDPKAAFWFFDGEPAAANEKYEAADRGLKPQLVGYVQDGKMVSQRNEHLQVDLKFVPAADGLTFKLAGAFYDTVPGGSPRPADWTGFAGRLKRFRRTPLSCVFRERRCWPPTRVPMSWCLPRRIQAMRNTSRPCSRRICSFRRENP